MVRTAHPTRLNKSTRQFVFLISDFKTNTKILNSYAYVGNNPNNFIDPRGLKWVYDGPNWYDWHFEFTDEEKEQLRQMSECTGQGMTDLLVRLPLDPILLYFQYTSPYVPFYWPWQTPSE